MGRAGNRSLTVRLDDADREYVGFLARELDTGMSEAVRELIRRDRHELEKKALKPLALTPGERRLLRKILNKL